MLRKFFIPLFATLAFSGCVSNFAALNDDKMKSQQSIDEMRMEIAELKHTLHAHQVDLQIIDEKLSHAKVLGKEEGDERLIQLGDRLHKLEGTLLQLQRFQESCIKDLKNLHEHVAKASLLIKNQNEQLTTFQSELSSQSKKMQDFKDLKSTLSSLKKAIDEPSASAYSIYKVKSGDTLEKIARQRGLSVNELRECNQLTSDNIRIGQELKLPL